MDRVVIVLGVAMLALTTYVAIKTTPPVGDALKQSVLPDSFNFLAITTLIGSSKVVLGGRRKRAASQMTINVRTTTSAVATIIKAQRNSSMLW